MERTARIEVAAAVCTDGCAVQIFFDGQLMAAKSAQHRFFIKPFFWPDSGMAAADCFVAFEACVKFTAAIELDGNPVNLGMPMGTPCFPIDLNPKNFRSMWHGFPPFFSRRWKSAKFSLFYATMKWTINRIEFFGAR